ncbi:pentatricopeptide repeat-containing protein-like, mitochondrial [Iris pallida]|uniref:Pentatricopeptide repeat-containing protein-like, mitochondrial n=1 Tax=Iris pallida TaxID=29817 RepID=A0AAX6FZR4_IRIPA|nr:pentatricopeptide repeat-containing protein-like, mitochondrial [Iris pallida]
MSRQAGRCRQLLQTKLPATFSTSARQLLDETPLRTTNTNPHSWFGFTTALRLIGACVRDAEASAGEPLHCLAVKTGLSASPFVGSSLVDLYSRRGLVGAARSVFDDVPARDLVLWNVMASCYSLNGLGVEAFAAFESMRKEGLFGDGFTLSILVSTCSSMGWGSLGKQLHSLATKLVPGSDVVAGSAIVDMYAKCRLVEDARRAFDLMDCRNVVSWNSIVVGYGRHGGGKEAMRLLVRMIRGGRPKPDEVTLASVLSSCADSAAAGEATQVHGFLAKGGYEGFTSVGNALIVAYARSGRIDSACKCFRAVSRPDSVSWNSMVSSFAFHGLAEKAIGAFDGMVAAGLEPDGIAFLGVLSACSHAGLVEQGWRYFASMREDYRIEPSPEHYTCLVDLLGRANRLSEAYDVVRSMPFEPGADVLAAFLGACKVHGDTALAEWAAERLLSVQPEEPPNYKAMANVYATLGRWDDVARLRKMMRDTRVRAIPGCSWIEVGDTVHTFLSTDKSHPRSSELYVMLRLLAQVIDGVFGDCSFSMEIEA